MTKKEKHLCDWKSDKIVAELDTYRDMVEKPKFVCKECGRVAGKKRWLCKPMPLFKD